MSDTMTKPIHWVSKVLDGERRVAYTTLEMRASEDSDGTTFDGYAAVFDSPSEPLGYDGFTEYVRRGAFKKTLNDGADVRLLIDHEGVPLARTKSGTLVLEEDDFGLRAVAKLDPANPDAARIISALGRGDLSQMSFAFRMVKENVLNGGSVRELTEVQLFDVSVVTYPAYESTVAQIRSLQPVTVPVVESFSILRKRQIEIARYR